MNRQLLVLLSAIALFVSACTGGSDSRPADPSTTAIQTTPSEESSTLTVEAAEEVRAKAFNYYISPDRRAKLQRVLDTLGKRLLDDMLAQRIPSKITNDGKGTTEGPAPTNGIAIVKSVPTRGDREGKPFVGVVVLMNHGEIDRSVGIISLVVLKDEAQYTLNGQWVIVGDDKLSNSTTESFRWRSFPPSAEFSVDSYDTVRDNESVAVSMQEIIAADDKFINQLVGTNVNGSDWN